MKKINIDKAGPLIKMAIEEDLGIGDITSELLFPKDTIDKASIISREEIVVSGIDIAEEILRCYDENLKLTKKIHFM